MRLPTFSAFVQMRTPAQNERELLHQTEGEAGERMQQIARAANAHAEGNPYAISPEKSHVS